MCWPSDSSMSVVRTFSSPIYRVRVAKPLDEAKRLAEIGGPLELKLVGPAVPTQWSWHSTMTNLQRHIAVVEVEVAAA